ncbi:uncharacterized protein LOC135213656 [Macrobrachium nipponense]|uniref:uncharacterized protein LOC135213656 n=1 Tax=Macrobrachium nipponense TaxID=159736 RepID=UPI0030C7A360
MKLLHRHLVLGLTIILLAVITDYADGLGSTDSSSGTSDSESNSVTSDSSSGASEATYSGSGASGTSDSSSGSTDSSSGTSDSESSVSADTSDSTTTEPAEVTTEKELDKKQILEYITAKLNETTALLKKLREIFFPATTTSGDPTAGVTTTEYVTTVPGAPTTDGATTKEDATTVSGAPTKDDATTKEDATTVSGAPTTDDATTGSSSPTEKPAAAAKDLQAEGIADICKTTDNAACNELQIAMDSVEAFTGSFDPTGEVSESDLKNITETSSGLDNAVEKVKDDPSGVNPDALNTKITNVEESIVEAKTKIQKAIEELEAGSGTDNTVAIVLGTLGGVLAVGIIIAVVIKYKKKKKKASKNKTNETP